MSAYYKSRIVYPNRKKESRRRALGFIFLLAGLCLFVGLLLWGLYSFARLEKFRIKHIAVEGTRVLSQDEIRVFAERALAGSFLFVIPKNHYVFASSRRLAGKLQAEFPRMKTVSVQKLFPDGMKISVKERTEWGIFCFASKIAATSTAFSADGTVDKSKCGYIDRDGILFEYPLEISGAFLPLIFDDSLETMRPGNRVVDEKTFSFFEGARDAGERELGVTFTALEITKELPDDYRLYAREGWYALVPRGGERSLWFDPLKTLLRREFSNRTGLEYVDARFGNKLFYKRK